MKKIYYKIEFCLTSALSVGSGENQYSDSDIIRDSQGNPFIPGSTLAGVYRSLLEEEKADRYFGALIVRKESDTEPKEKREESKVRVYDAQIQEEAGKYCVSTRDCVKLDEWKTSVEGSKFDFEVIEPGAVFITYLEQDMEDGDEDICARLANAWIRQRIQLGRKTARGLGAVKSTKIYREAFDLTQEDSLKKWLAFDLYQEDCWKTAWTGSISAEENNAGIQVRLQLRQKSGISIRRYTTGGQADSEQLTCRVGEEGKEEPLIPGTSWAGAFRHHMEKLLRGSTGRYFGYCDEKEKRKSSVFFSESLIQGAEAKVLTRNAVDRFTGGVVRNALFTEKMWYGGETELTVGFPAGVNQAFRQAMAASIADLHMGLLTVGGLTSVGRGIFEITEASVNGEKIELEGEKFYEALCEKFGEVE